MLYIPKYKEIHLQFGYNCLICNSVHLFEYYSICLFHQDYDNFNKDFSELRRWREFTLPNRGPATPDVLVSNVKVPIGALLHLIFLLVMLKAEVCIPGVNLRYGAGTIFIFFTFKICFYKLCEIIVPFLLKIDFIAFD